MVTSHCSDDGVVESTRDNIPTHGSACWYSSCRSLAFMQGSRRPPAPCRPTSEPIHCSPTRPRTDTPIASISLRAASVVACGPARKSRRAAPKPPAVVVVVALVSYCRVLRRLHRHHHHGDYEDGLERSADTQRTRHVHS